jgi:hypothetical protein
MKKAMTKMLTNTNDNLTWRFLLPVEKQIIHI